MVKFSIHQQLNISLQKVREASPLLHGIEHWRAVEKNVIMFVDKCSGDVEVARLFAIFHDCKRQNENIDPGHGERAAEFLKSLNGKIFSLSDDRFKLLYKACFYHNKGIVDDNPTIGACWDADRMELPRVGITPDPSLMSTKEGKRLAVQS